MSFSAQIQELYNTWWVSGIVLPVFYTVFLGGPIAIYTGLVAARKVAFDEALQRSRSLLLTLPHLIAQSHGFIEAKQQAALHSMEPIKKLVEIGQPTAANHLSRLAFSMAERCKDALAVHMTEAEKTNPSKIPTHRWQRIVFPATGDIYAAMNWGLSQTDMIRPDWRALIYLPAFVDSLLKAVAGRRSDCSACCQNCNRVL